VETSAHRAHAQPANPEGGPSSDCGELQGTEGHLHGIINRNRGTGDGEGLLRVPMPPFESLREVKGGQMDTSIHTVSTSTCTELIQVRCVELVIFSRRHDSWIVQNECRSSQERFGNSLAHSAVKSGTCGIQEKDTGGGRHQLATASEGRLISSSRIGGQMDFPPVYEMKLKS
jgi:hypothetical protein